MPTRRMKFHFLISCQMNRHQRRSNFFKVFMKTTKYILAAFLILPIVVTNLTAEMPQDHWYFNGTVITGSFGAITIGTDGNIYSATNGGAISVFGTDGSFIRQFGSNLNVAGIAVDSQTNIYVVDYAGAQKLKKFNSAGNLLLSFGDAGAGPNQFNPGFGTSRITIDKNDRIYIADAGNNRVQVADINGNIVQVWNDTVATSDPTWFQKVAGIVAAPNDLLLTWSPSAHFILAFNSNGNWVATGAGVGLDSNPRGPSISVTPDGLIALLSPSRFEIYMSGQPNNISLAAGLSGNPFPTTSLNGIAVDKYSTLYISAQTSAGGVIFGANRHFGHIPPNYNFVDAGFQTNSAVPVPLIEAARQRPNTTLVDLDYKVNDPDSSVVTVGLLAFRGGVSDGTERLAKLIKLTSFAENTETNLGLNQLPNVKIGRASCRERV